MSWIDRITAEATAAVRDLHYSFGWPDPRPFFPLPPAFYRSAKLVRCPACRYPKRCDGTPLVSEGRVFGIYFGVVECSNAECGERFDSHSGEPSRPPSAELGGFRARTGYGTARLRSDYIILSGV